jgi:uncharacterized membrane protein
MHASGIHYFPLALPFLLVLVGLWLALLTLVLLHVVRYAYASMGIAPQHVFAVLVLSLVGSYVNIPVMQFPHESVLSEQEVLFFGMRYVIPVVRDWPGTAVTVNLGGAVIPALVSLYLLLRNQLYWRGLLGILIVGFVCHRLAHPVPGLGIAVPTFIPPVATAVVALLLSRRHAGALAYISGSLGTLVGADLLHLGWVQGLGSPVVSIGGAGTFDGIFVTGLVAVLLASLAAGVDADRAHDGRPGQKRAPARVDPVVAHDPSLEQPTSSATPISPAGRGVQRSADVPSGVSEPT